MLFFGSSACTIALPVVFNALFECVCARVRVCMTKVREDMCKRERGGIGIVCKKDRVKERKRKRIRERGEGERRPNLS